MYLKGAVVLLGCLCLAQAAVKKGSSFSSTQKKQVDPPGCCKDKSCPEDEEHLCEPPEDFNPFECCEDDSCPEDMKLMCILKDCCEAKSCPPALAPLCKLDCCAAGVCPKDIEPLCGDDKSEEEGFNPPECCNEENCEDDSVCRPPCCDEQNCSEELEEKCGPPPEGKKRKLLNEVRNLRMLLEGKKTKK